MMYTPGQLKNVTGISPETYRHWRTRLKPLETRSGKAARFSVFDIVSVLIVRVAVEDLGVSVASLRGVSQTLFDLVEATPWPQLQHSAVVISLPESTVRLVPVDEDIRRIGRALVIPLDDLTEQVSASLLPTVEASQREFFFPLTNQKRAGRRI